MSYDICKRQSRIRPFTNIPIIAIEMFISFCLAIFQPSIYRQMSPSEITLTLFSCRAQQIHFLNWWGVWVTETQITHVCPSLSTMVFLVTCQWKSIWNKWDHSSPVGFITLVLLSWDVIQPPIAKMPLFSSVFYSFTLLSHLCVILSFWRRSYWKCCKNISFSLVRQIKDNQWRCDHQTPPSYPTHCESHAFTRFPPLCLSEGY